MPPSGCRTIYVPAPPSASPSICCIICASEDAGGGGGAYILRPPEGGNPLLEVAFLLAGIGGPTVFWMLAARHVMLAVSRLRLRTGAQMNKNDHTTLPCKWMYTCMFTHM